MERVPVICARAEHHLGVLGNELLENLINNFSNNLDERLTHRKNRQYLVQFVVISRLQFWILGQRQQSVKRFFSQLPLCNQVLEQEEPLTEESLAGETQKTLSHRINQHHHQWLLNTVDTARDKARLNSLGLPHAGDWLHVVPSPSLGLHLKPQDFRFGVLYRLGAPLYMNEGPCTACGALSDIMGDHARESASPGITSCEMPCTTQRQALF